MRSAQRILELLHEVYPTSDQIRHNITLEKMLGITVWFPRTEHGAWFCQTFYLTDDELDKTPEQLVELIQQVVKEKNLNDPNSN